MAGPSATQEFLYTFCDRLHREPEKFECVKGAAQLSREPRGYLIVQSINFVMSIGVTFLRFQSRCCSSCFGYLLFFPFVAGLRVSIVVLGIYRVFGFYRNSCHLLLRTLVVPL